MENSYAGQVNPISKESQVKTAMSALAVVDKELTETVARLSARISPVLRQEPKQERDPEKAIPPYSTPLANEIAYISLRLKERIREINEILNLVEL